MNPAAIRAKFGGSYIADDRTYKMGIDQRFTAHVARRFHGRSVLEACTGGGFTTIALARAATHVTTIEIDPVCQEQARENVKRAGLSDRVTFLLGDVLDERVLSPCRGVDAAFLDPDWAVTGPDHVYRFRPSNTRPPADTLLVRVLDLTLDVALVLPPLVDTRELEGLPAHELQNLYLGEKHELYCLYFGSLAQSPGLTVLRV